MLGLFGGFQRENLKENHKFSGYLRLIGGFRLECVEWFSFIGGTFLYGYLHETHGSYLRQLTQFASARGPRCPIARRPPRLAAQVSSSTGGSVFFRVGAFFVFFFFRWCKRDAWDAKGEACDVYNAPPLTPIFVWFRQPFIGVVWIGGLGI